MSHSSWSLGSVLSVGVYPQKTSNSWDFRECLCWSHKRKKGKEEERNQSMFPKSQKENMPQILGHGFSSDLYLISSRIQFFIPLPYLGPKTILCHYLRKPKLYWKERRIYRSWIKCYTVFVYSSKILGLFDVFYSNSQLLFVVWDHSVIKSIQ